MGSAKDLVLRPISSREANDLVRRVHYSGKVVQNSQVHIGVFYEGALRGALQFGPSIDKRKTLRLVEGTPWNGYLELNRLAFEDTLPRNSESRALAVSMRLLRRHAPQVQWVVSFADAAQCGDGTIYRAAGFALTNITPNRTMLRMPNGDIVATKTLNNTLVNGRYSIREYLDAGAQWLPGYQLRYVYFLDPTARQRLTAPILDYDAIDRAGARMYRGQPGVRAGSIDSDASANPGGRGQCNSDPGAPLG